MTPTISWLSHGKDRKSRDGRWHIRHPSTTPSKKWELYDVKAGQWYGDWPTKTAAKQRAEQIELREQHEATR